jgi:replicative DNA helicase
LSAEMTAITDGIVTGSDLESIGTISHEIGPTAIFDPSKRDPGLKTGLLRFDDMTGGLRDGELFILAARPAMGKTALAMGIAQYVAAHNRIPVAAFSLEMSKQSLLTRMLCAQARVDQQRYRAGYLNSTERTDLSRAMEVLNESPLYIDDSGSLTITDVHAKCERLRQRLGRNLGLVVIDYLQLMKGSGKFENRQQEISSISRGFKLLSKEFGAPFLVLSQLSRGPDTRPGDHRPQLSDLRESGSIEQDADMVGFIFREEVYRPDKESLKGIAELILAKQRNGPTGRIRLAFLNRFTKFENLAGDTGSDDLPFEDGDSGSAQPPFWKPRGEGLTEFAN